MVLDRLLDSTRARVSELKQKVTVDALEQRIASTQAARSLTEAVAGGPISIIAEIKRASPLKGPLDLDLNASDLAAAYGEGGAAAISVLTEPTEFKGSIEDLRAAIGVGLPVLRKDFIVDEFQVLEARAEGADAVLLIVRATNDETLASLFSSARTLGMDSLVEVHDESELQRALDVGARLIGVNHRDLTTFEVDPDRTAKLAALVPPDVTLVALSGISQRAEVESLERAGAAAVLVGECLVTAPDPAAKLRELLGGT